MTPHPRIARDTAASLAMLLLAACVSGQEQARNGVASGQAVLAVADEARRSGNPQAAFGMYQQAVASDARSFPAQLGLADTAYQLGQIDISETAARAAVTLSPNSAEAAYGLARARLARGDKAGAIATVDQALASGTSAPDLYDAKAVALDLMGRHDAAQATYRLGLERDPADRRLRNNYALSLAASRLYPPAIDLLRALAAEPDATARNRQNLALVLGLAGDTAAARAVAGKDQPVDEIDSNARFYDAARGQGSSL